MTSIKVLKFCTVLNLFGIYCSIVSSQPETNPCRAKETCRECVKADAKCAWCLEVDKSVSTFRSCDLASNMRETCPSRDYSPLSIAVPRGPDDILESLDDLQLYPQGVVDLYISPNRPTQLFMNFRHLEKFPLDLYFLVDLSKPTENYKYMLAILARRLANQLPNITSNFRLGYGPFMGQSSKTEVSTVGDELEERSVNEAQYRHYMSLGMDTSRFSEEIQNIGGSENGKLTTPRGLNVILGVIMQSIVCKKEVGWREHSSKLLLFFSNSGVHAYSAKGEGISEPNEDRCHLDRHDNSSENFLQKNYTVKEVNEKLKDNKINIIFAVTPEELYVYKPLSDQLDGSYLLELGNDPTDLLNKVKEFYQNVTSSIELRSDAPDYIKITYSSKCLDGEMKERNVCEGLAEGKAVFFTVRFEALSCPKDPKLWNDTFTIYPLGVNESLSVHMKMACNCPCEDPDKTEINSEKCSNAGTFQCGICICNKTRSGRWCECDSLNPNSKIDLASCTGKDSSVCSNRGICSCGGCQCPDRPEFGVRIYGQFCECDNFSCDRHAGRICNGDHGACECGVCICKAGWKGSACECRDSTDTCMGSDGEICSGHGYCECGHCKCVDTEEGRFSGPLCEYCPTCRSSCNELRDCVQCQMYGTGLSPEECQKCSFTPVKVDVIEGTDTEMLCVFRDESDDCKFVFKYRTDEDDDLMVLAQIDKECPT